MFKSFGLQVRRQEKSHADYMDHWLNIHAPMSAGIPPLRGYVLNEVLGEATAAGTAKLDMLTEIDGIAQLWFDQPDGLQALAEYPGVKSWFSDGPNYVGERIGFVTQETVARPVEAAPRPSCKYISFIARPDGMAAEEFRRRLHQDYAPLARGVPRLKGLVVSDVLSANASPNLPAFATPALDAITEIWVDSSDGLARALASAEGAAFAAAGAKLFGKVRTLLTREMVVKPPAR